MSWTHCCCCFDIRCGTITIGILLLINHGMEVIASIAGVIVSAHISPYDSGVSRESFLWASCTALIIMGTWFVLDCLLMRGVTSENPCLVLAWLCWAIPVTFLSVVGACVILGLTAKYVDEEGVIALPITLLINYLVLAYWVLVVLMYYRSMKEKTRVRAAAMSAQMAPAPILAYGQPGMLTVSPQEGGLAIPHQQSAAGMSYRQQQTPVGYPRGASPAVQRY